MRKLLFLAACAAALGGCQSDGTVNWTAVGALGGLALGAAAEEDVEPFMAMGGAAGHAVEVVQHTDQCAAGPCPPLDQRVTPPVPQTTEERTLEALRREALSGEDDPEG